MSCLWLFTAAGRWYGSHMEGRMAGLGIYLLEDEASIDERIPDDFLRGYGLFEIDEEQRDRLRASLTPRP